MSNRRSPTGRRVQNNQVPPSHARRVVGSLSIRAPPFTKFRTNYQYSSDSSPLPADCPEFGARYTVTRSNSPLPTLRNRGPPNRQPAPSWCGALSMVCGVPWVVWCGGWPCAVLSSAAAHGAVPIPSRPMPRVPHNLRTSRPQTDTVSYTRAALRTVPSPSCSLSLRLSECCCLEPLCARRQEFRAVIFSGSDRTAEPDRHVVVSNGLVPFRRHRCRATTFV